MRNDEISAEQKKILYPDRELCGNVYRYLRKNAGWSFGEEILCFRLGLKEEKIGACRVALEALTEIGVLINDNGRYRLPKEQVKAELENSELLKKLSK